MILQVRVYGHNLTKEKHKQASKAPVWYQPALPKLAVSFLQRFSPLSRWIKKLPRHDHFSLIAGKSVWQKCHICVLVCGGDVQFLNVDHVSRSDQCGYCNCISVLRTKLLNSLDLWKQRLQPFLIFQQCVLSYWELNKHCRANTLLFLAELAKLELCLISRRNNWPSSSAR